MGKARSGGRAELAVLMGLSLSWGCATAQWAKPIGDFQASVDASVSVIGSYYKDLNVFERRLYLESVALDPKQGVFATSGGKPTALAGKVFSADSIQARLDALRLVSAYGRRLA